VDVCTDSITIEITGDIGKIEAFLDLTKVFGIKEISRTGVTAMQRG
jgi:acetolactate synthase-1/3 small subunit